MIAREHNARQMANKDGRNWDDLNEVMRNAYLHNADVAIADRAAQAAVKAEAEAPHGPVTCPVCKGEGWLDSKPCHECNPVGLPKKTDLEEKPKPSELPSSVIVEPADKITLGEYDDRKPRELKPGEYFCTKCQSPHRKTSKKGIKHLKYELQAKSPEKK